MKKTIIIIITTMICLIITSNKVKAEEINYTGQFRLQFYSLATGTTALTSVGNFNTAQQLSTGYGVSKIIPRYYGITFKGNTKYRVTTIVGFAPVSITESFTYVDNIGCFGTTSTNNWSADSSLIKSCEIIKVERVPNQNRIKYTVDITPKQNIPGIQFNINTTITEEVRVVNVYNASSITTTDNVIGAIGEQTIEIEGAISDAVEDILNQNHEYENEDINNFVDALENTENTIKNQLTPTITDQITWSVNGEANTFIWNEFERFIKNNPYLWLLITSILGLGIIKLVLGR